MGFNPEKSAGGWEDGLVGEDDSYQIFKFEVNLHNSLNKRREAVPAKYLLASTHILWYNTCHLAHSTHKVGKYIKYIKYF